MRRLRHLGVRVGGVAARLVGKLGVTETVAADASGGRLALLHRGKAAAGHVAGHVLPAKLAGRRSPGRQRTKNGRGGNGRRRRAKITDETRDELKKLVQAGKTGNEIAKTLGISLPSVQNIKKALGLVRGGGKKK